MNKNFILYFFITLLFFGMLIKIEYATDTYAVLNFDKEAVFMQYAMSGRFITAFVFYFLKLINISENVLYLLSYGLAIFCTSMSQYLLYKLIKEDIKSKIFNLIIPTLIVVNPFSIELFLYIEKGIMWFGILMCILAIQKLVSYYKTNRKKYIFYSVIYIFVANCSYQGIVGIFVAISLVFILKYSKNIKQFVINNILVGGIYALPAVIDFIIVKIFFKSSRINGKIIFFESLDKILKNSINMIVNMYGILPKYAFILLILFTFIVFCSKIWKDRNFLHIFKFAYIIIGITVISILPQFIQPTNSIWFVPRSTYSFASMYEILTLYLAMNYNLEKTLNNLIIIISLILIFFQVQRFIKIEKDRFLLNQKDEKVTIQIINQIDYYEIQTGNIITQVSIYQDKNPNYTYEGIFATGDMNIKSYSTDWSSLEILKYYSKKELKLVEKNENIEQEFKKKSWDEFNLDQIVFKENTINICNY